MLVFMCWSLCMCCSLLVYMLFLTCLHAVPFLFVTVADNAANANFFRELGGVEAVTELLPFGSTRPLALRLITHLILSEGTVSSSVGSVNALVLQLFQGF